MNGAHWHLVVNHLPLIFPLVGIITLLTGLIAKSEAVKRMAFLIFILGALATIAAMTTGEGAEDIVEKISGVAKIDIHNHEEAAETFALLAYILGAISLLALWASIKQQKTSTALTIVTLVFAVVLLYFAKQTGTTGGNIRHTEIKSEPSPAISGRQ